MPGGRLVLGRVAGVDVLGTYPEQARELLDDHLEDQLAKIIVAVGCAISGRR